MEKRIYLLRFDPQKKNLTLSHQHKNPFFSTKLISLTKLEFLLNKKNKNDKNMQIFQVQRPF